MAFVKERISVEDKNLFNSFEVYDYDNERILTWALAGGLSSKWVIDRKREIYFFYVSGGHHLEQHPYQQYDLIWNGKKVVIFLEKWGNYDAKSDEERCSHYTYDIIDIRAPQEFMSLQREMVELIEELIKINHAIDITNNGIYKNKNTMTIKNICIPQYSDEVR